MMAWVLSSFDSPSPPRWVLWFTSYWQRKHPVLSSLSISLSRHQPRPPASHHVVYFLEFQQNCPQGLFRVHFSILLSALLSCKGTLCPIVTTSKSHCPSLFLGCALYAVTVLSLPETCTVFISLFRNSSSPELLILHKTLVLQLDCLKFYLCHHKAIKLVLVWSSPSRYPGRPGLHKEIKAGTEQLSSWLIVPCPLR